MTNMAITFSNVLGKFSAKRRGPSPIVPGFSASGRTLMFLIAIMTFLSCVTYGAVVLVQKSALGWSAEVSREITIMIRPIEGEVMESNLRTAAALAESSPGIAQARPISEAETLALLQPWLGSGLDLSTLELPRLIAVEIADPRDVDIAALERSIATIPGASLDTHSAWRQQLNVMAGTIVVSGTIVLGLIIVATVLAVVFATGGTMAANRQIVDVLHFIGASNKFIAGEFQERFLKIGLKGGLIGGSTALLFFIIVSIVVSAVLPDQSSAQLSVLFGRFSLGFWGIFGIVLIVPVIAALTALTSRITVRQFLSQIS
jgi:cell division transport system permease protein